MIKGLFFILLFYFLGEVCSIGIDGFIPGSVIGMILLFLSLFFKLIAPESVKDAATVITKNMAVFFVPPAVGLMAYAELISQSIWAISLAIIVSTVLTIIVVAVIQESFEKRKERTKTKNKWKSSKK
ncbi:CidA/LrgA family protein [Parabacteroides sp. 52]|uniref:CidA/LrgA family protein n=1 Tax=unclassified Parabacteroides TaxID=2649774 RepID=UPI0013D563F8|nr:MULTISPECIES: CidA/LrgA family protein [unclassified Parabacteroides]NDV55818.1 CidA/LrgA family protein [Parabacteroides sp. 52]